MKYNQHLMRRYLSKSHLIFMDTYQERICLFLKKESTSAGNDCLDVDSCIIYPVSLIYIATGIQVYA